LALKISGWSDQLLLKDYLEFIDKGIFIAVANQAVNILGLKHLHRSSPLASVIKRQPAKEK
jgi:hypothetical protein